MLYMALLIVAVILNRKYKRNLLLTLVVGLSGLMPMQMVTDYYWWWAICLGFELFKIVLALILRTRISYPVIFLCCLMFICHMTLLFVDNTLPHKIINPMLEHLEIICCTLFSPIILHHLKNYIKRKLNVN